MGDGDRQGVVRVPIDAGLVPVQVQLHGAGRSTDISWVSVWFLSISPENANVALVSPAGTVTLVGTVATPVSLLASDTTAPSDGVAPVNVAVADELAHEHPHEQDQQRQPK